MTPRLLSSSLAATPAARPRRKTMRRQQLLCAIGLALVTASAPAGAAETPKRGGSFTFMIPSDAPPTLDGHREGTFATLHATAPFYSVLIRVNPENPSSTTDFVCDLCLKVPQP